MSGFGTLIDNSAILKIVGVATKEDAMQLRSIWRQQLLWLEEVYQLPRSFETKADRDRRIAYGGLPSRDDA